MSVGDFLVQSSAAPSLAYSISIRACSTARARWRVRDGARRLALNPERASLPRVAQGDDGEQAGLCVLPSARSRRAPLAPPQGRARPHVQASGCDLSSARRSEPGILAGPARIPFVESRACAAKHLARSPLIAYIRAVVPGRRRPLRLLVEATSAVELRLPRGSARRVGRRQRANNGADRILARQRSVCESWLTHQPSGFPRGEISKV